MRPSVRALRQAHDCEPGLTLAEYLATGHVANVASADGVDDDLRDLLSEADRTV